MTDLIKRDDEPLPPPFDLFLDAKQYKDIKTQYHQACYIKSMIEELCLAHNVLIPELEERNE